jgi:hypothetical protein
VRIGVTSRELERVRQSRGVVRTDIDKKRVPEFERARVSKSSEFKFEFEFERGSVCLRETYSQQRNAVVQPLNSSCVAKFQHHVTVHGSELENIDS